MMSMADTVRLVLVLPSIDDADAVWKYRAVDWQAGEHIPGSSGLGRAKSYAEWLAQSQTRREAASVVDNIVPSTVYLAKRVSDNKLIGMVDIRHSLNDYLRAAGGHIGYSVHPEFRRQGYGTEILELALEKCRELGIDPVLVTCDRDNTASSRVILANGGVLENETIDGGGVIKRRYWIKLSN